MRNKTKVDKDPQGRLHVALSDEDVILGRAAGKLRYESSREQGLSNPDGSIFSVEQDTEGALAEIAFARALGVEADLGLNTFHAPDIAGFQVRSTILQSGKLIVRPTDLPRDEFVLVVGIPGNPDRWIVIGSRIGRACQDPDWWYAGSNGRPGCWMVPQEYLYPLDSKLRKQEII